MYIFTIDNTTYAKSISDHVRETEYIEGDPVLEPDMVKLELEVMQDRGVEIDIPLSLMITMGEKAKEIKERMEVEEPEPPKTARERVLEGLEWDKKNSKVTII